MSTANSSRPRERRGRSAFWIDDRIIDQYGPLLEQFPFGADALAVYAVLARRASDDGESWERIKSMARLAATKERTFQRCIRLLELLGLVGVESCYFEGTNIRTSNRYTLLAPPQEPPEVDPDSTRWPAPVRPVVFVSRGVNRRHVTDARPRSSRAVEESRSREEWARSSTPARGIDPLDSVSQPASLLVQVTGCRPDTTPDVRTTPTPRREDTTPGVTPTPHEGTSTEGLTGKEESHGEKESKDDASLAVLPSGRLAVSAQPSFVFPEVGLTNRQVWAATLGELARRGEVGRTELESWLRPAALIGRDGTTLVIGAPNAVSRERIATRLLPALREALTATIGAPVEVSVVVAALG